MATQLPWARKPKASGTPHYYEGFVEKKKPWEKDYKRYWAGLHGLALYFYNASRDVQYVEKIDLADFVSLADNNPPRTAATWPTEEARLTLKTRTQEVMLKLESLESREMWKGVILTVVELKVPSTLMLLPGHLYMLSEALEKEKKRRSKPNQADPKEEEELPEHAIPSKLHACATRHGEEPLVGLPMLKKQKRADAVARTWSFQGIRCFFRVSRTEAEVLLEKNENGGNMLLRPGGDGKSIAVTTRQTVNGTVAVKHYKIQVDGGEYIIDVEEPFRCSSLAGVVDFFVTNSKRLLVPLSLDESYAMTFEIMEMDKESGESIPVPAKTARVPPKPLKGAPGGEKATMLPRGRPPLPPLPPVFPDQPPVPPREAQPEHVYLQEDPPERTYMNDGVATMRRTLSSGNMKGVTGSPVLSTARKNHTPPKTPQRTPARLATSLPRSFSVEMSEELVRKLQERRATLQE